MTREELGLHLNQILANLEAFVSRSKEHDGEHVDLVIQTMIKCHEDHFQQDPVSCDIFLLKTFQICMSTRDVIFVKRVHKVPKFAEEILNVTARIWGVGQPERLLGGRTCYTKEQLRDSLVQTPGVTCPVPGEISSLKGKGYFNE